MESSLGAIKRPTFFRPYTKPSRYESRMDEEKNNFNIMDYSPAALAKQAGRYYSSRREVNNISQPLNQLPTDKGRDDFRPSEMRLEILDFGNQLLKASEEIFTKDPYAGYSEEDDIKTHAMCNDILIWSKAQKEFRDRLQKLKLLRQKFIQRENTTPYRSEANYETSHQDESPQKPTIFKRLSESMKKGPSQMKLQNSEKYAEKNYIVPGRMPSINQMNLRPLPAADAEVGIGDRKPAYVGNDNRLKQMFDEEHVIESNPEGKQHKGTSDELRDILENMTEQTMGKPIESNGESEGEATDSENTTPNTVKNVSKNDKLLEMLDKETTLQSKLKSPNSSESSESSASSKELNVILQSNKEERLGRPKVPKNATSKVNIDSAAQTETEYGLYSKPKNELEKTEKKGSKNYIKLNKNEKPEVSKNHMILNKGEHFVVHEPKPEFLTSTPLSHTPVHMVEEPEKGIQKGLDMSKFTDQEIQIYLQVKESMGKEAAKDLLVKGAFKAQIKPQTEEMRIPKRIESQKTKMKSENKEYEITKKDKAEKKKSDDLKQQNAKKYQKNIVEQHDYKMNNTFEVQIPELTDEDDIVKEYPLPDADDSLGEAEETLVEGESHQGQEKAGNVKEYSDDVKNHLRIIKRFQVQDADMQAIPSGRKSKQDIITAKKHDELLKTLNLLSMQLTNSFGEPSKGLSKIRRKPRANPIYDDSDDSDYENDPEHRMNAMLLDIGGASSSYHLNKLEETQIAELRRRTTHQNKEAFEDLLMKYRGILNHLKLIKSNIQFNKKLGIKDEEDDEETADNIKNLKAMEESLENQMSEIASRGQENIRKLQMPQWGDVDYADPVAVNAIPVFNPNRRESDTCIYQTLTSALNFAGIANLTTKTTKNVIYDRLRGEAAKWFQVRMHKPEEDLPIETLLSELLNRFEEDTSKQEYEEELRNYRRKTGEKMKTAICRLTDLIERSNPDMTLDQREIVQNSHVKRAMKDNCDENVYKEALRAEWKSRDEKFSFADALIEADRAHGSEKWFEKENNHQLSAMIQKQQPQNKQHKGPRGGRIEKQRVVSPYGRDRSKSPGPPNSYLRTSSPTNQQYQQKQKQMPQQMPQQMQQQSEQYQMPRQMPQMQMPQMPQMNQMPQQMPQMPPMPQMQQQYQQQSRQQYQQNPNRAHNQQRNGQGFKKNNFFQNRNQNYIPGMPTIQRSQPMNRDNNNRSFQYQQRSPSMERNRPDHFNYDQNTHFNNYQNQGQYHYNDPRANRGNRRSPNNDGRNYNQGFGNQKRYYKQNAGGRKGSSRIDQSVSLDRNEMMKQNIQIGDRCNFQPCLTNGEPPHLAIHCPIAIAWMKKN